MLNGGEIRHGTLMPCPIARYSPDGIGGTSPGLSPTLCPWFCRSGPVKVWEEHRLGTEVQLDLDPRSATFYLGTSYCTCPAPLCSPVK